MRGGNFTCDSEKLQSRVVGAVGLAPEGTSGRVVGGNEAKRKMKGAEKVHEHVLQVCLQCWGGRGSSERVGVGLTTPSHLSFYHPCPFLQKPLDGKIQSLGQKWMVLWDRSFGYRV